ncbi:hypothetical protein BASA81_014099 [Batrachochytrium salamandrivorans]|nr:hypothetical protein BASA81_014099 [Batrachochytrium salamandrivorans]
MQFSGSQITRLSTVHGRRHSSIDHFVCNAPARALLTSPRVDRQTAVADHFVIRTSIRAEAQGQPPVPRAPTISRHHCLEATDRIATSNYWDVLADGASDDTDTDTDIHQLTSQFLESANAVADNLSLRLSPPATRSNRRLLSGTTKRAILASNTARQAFIAAATHTNPDPVQCNTLRDEWSRLKAAATQLERVDGRKQWVKHADNLDRAVSDGRTDLVFSAARAMSGNSSRSAAVTPLYNSDGIVQYDPTSILRVMQGHYGSLAADTTGHSLDLQYWHDRQPIQVSPNTPPIRNSDILDQDFSWNQIAAALLQMSPRKAPGDDGITTAFYQAALYMPANTQEGVPPTPFARALLRVCGQVFASATIPRAWLCASIVSIDKKDGDPLNPGDKRGIALINVGLKLVCKVLQMRIERFVETNNLLVLRTGWVPQARRAFDTVPVGALLWKLQNMGFPRRTLAFLKALYTSSSARARAGSLLSDPFPVQRGVRQGCPLSGLLFNLFINDILDGVAPITVPGLPRDTNPIRGLMYADDVAVFADSEQSLLAASTAIEQWANQWEMQFGVAKCGIISFTGHLAPRLDNPLDIRLHGQLVSRVESYKYLGVLIDSKLDHSAWLKQKRSALEHTISALHPVLANHQLTVNYRSRIFSAVVMGKAYYGLELVGGNKSHLAPLQTTINKGIRLFTGARLSTAIGPLLVETGIGSLLTRSLVSRLVRSQRWFWSRRTKQLYRNRYWLTPQVRPKTVKQRHSFALMETLRTCGDSASLQKYVTRQLLDTSGFFKDPSFDQSRAHGTRYLMLARMDALWTARKAIQIGILVDTHPFSVDHCILCDQQLLSTSIAHLVVECEQVTGHRIQSGLVPAIQKSRLRLLGRALDPGVENVYTWLRGGVLNGEADLDQRWLDGTVEHESMGTRHDNRALAARLADFLQVAYRQYQSTLWKYHRDRLVEIVLTDNDVFTLNVQGQLVRSQRWFWSRRTKQLYRNRYWLTPQVRPKTVKQRHSFALMETLQTCGDSASLQKYVTRQLLDTSGFFKDPSFDQSRAHGTRYLMLARMDALWTARKAIQIGILVDTHPFSVDHCILCDQQLLSTSIAHLVVDCEQVTGHRIQSGLVPAIQKSRLRLLGRALDPGVENVYTWLRGGVLNGEADLDQRWLDGTVKHKSMGTRHDNRALAARLADFLQVAYRQYQSTLWKYHRDRLVEVG